MLSGALLLGCALLLLGLSALLLLDGVHNVAALLLGVGGALLPWNLPGHGLALLHRSAAALLLVLCLVVGHTPGGADGLGDCGAGGGGDGVVDGAALWRHGDSVCHGNCRGSMVLWILVTADSCLACLLVCRSRSASGAELMVKGCHSLEATAGILMTT